MNKIINIKQAAELSKQLKGKGKTIVLAGGVFDILHIGHIKFLEEAKKKGHHLFVLLESDESVKKLKGKDRPVNNQKNRAEVLSSLIMTDSIIILKEILKNDDYDKLVKLINPDILVTTEGDKNIKHKLRQAKKINAKVLSVINRIPDKSSSAILKSILE